MHSNGRRCQLIPQFINDSLLLLVLLLCFLQLRLELHFNKRDHSCLISPPSGLLQFISQILRPLLVVRLAGV